MEGIKCTYCGADNGNNLDHVIPAYYLGSRKWDSSSQWLTPCCKTCNSLAGSIVVFSIPDKAKILLKKYNTKYRRILKSPEWTEEEMEDMGYQMKILIEQGLLAKRYITKRVDFLYNVSNRQADYMRPLFVENMLAEYRLLLAKKKKPKKKSQLS